MEQQCLKDQWPWMILVNWQNIIQNNKAQQYLIDIVLFFQQEQTIIIEEGMRKSSKKLKYNYSLNRYDQMTNLGIEVETSIHRSIVFPKISSKIADQEAMNSLVKRHMRTDDTVNHLKEELAKLHSNLYMLQAKNEVSRLKNLQQTRKEPQQQPNYYYQQACKYRQDRTEQSKANKSSKNIANQRTQRNTDDSYFRPRFKNGEASVNRTPLQETNDKSSTSNKHFQNITSIKIAKSVHKLSNISSVSQQNNPLIDKSKIKPKTKRNLRLRRKFRIAAFVVYFSVLLPSFAKKIYKYRLRNFMLNYPHEISKYFMERSEEVSLFKEDESKLWTFMETKLNILEAVTRQKLPELLQKGSEVLQIKQYFKFLIKQDLDQEPQSVKKQFTVEEQLMFPKNTDHLLKGFSKIIGDLTDVLTDFIANGDLFQLSWKTFSLGISHNYFINNSHPKLLAKVIDSGAVRLHPFKQILLVYDKEMQATLLVFDIICRMFSYNWMIKIQKMDMNKNQQSTLVIANFMLTILYVIGQKMLDKQLKSFQKLNLNLDDKVKLRNKSIRPIVPLTINKYNLRDQTLLKSNNLIANPPLLQKSMTFISENPQFQTKIMANLKEIGYELYQKMKPLMRNQIISTKSKILQQDWNSMSLKTYKNAISLQSQGRKIKKKIKLH